MAVTHKLCDNKGNIVKVEQLDTHQRSTPISQVAGAKSAEGRALWDGYPGPPDPPAEDEPIRVMYYTRAARAEGQECYADYLAQGMPEGVVEWDYIVQAHKDGDGTGEMLKRHGPVHLLRGEADMHHWQFLRHVLDFRPHLVHANSKAGVQLALGCGLPCVATGHGIKGGEWYGADIADTSVRVSPAGIQAAKHTILSGLEPLPWPEVRHTNKVAWLGRLDKDRKPELFLDALVQAPKARAVIIGRANQREFDCQAEIDKRDLTDRVEYLGHLPPAEARRIASECSIVVSTVDESFGFSTAELMTAGVRPVVVTGPGYQSTMAANWGPVVAPTATALGEAIREVLADDWGEEQRQAMADETAMRYSTERMADEYLELYRKLIVPRTDIVILAQNELEVTRSCLAHVVANTWVPYRLILVDNGSTEPLAELFKRTRDLIGQDRCLVLEPSENLGGPGGRDLAYQHTASPYFAWLDNDMLVPPGWLGPLMRTMQQNPRAAVVAPWSEVYSPGWRGQPPKQTVISAANNLFRTQAAREVEEESGQLGAEPFRTMQGRTDSDFLWRLLEAGWQLWRDGTVELHHLGGPLRKTFAQGMTRRHGDTAKMIRADKAFKAKWVSPGVRR